MTKPISPDEVTKAKLKALPDKVLEIFNELIARNWDGQSATIKQCDIIVLIQLKLNSTRNEIFNNGWLDVEPIYRDAGWAVKYDKPAYCETYEPTFTFCKKNK